MTRYLLSILLVALVSSGASADISSRNVIAAFRGQLVISKAELSEGKNDKDTISKIKAANLTALEGEARDDVTYWLLHNGLHILYD